MDMVVTASAPHRCDANAHGRTATEWGMEFVPCQIRTGLRSFTDRQGIERFFCGSTGHEANAKRRFGLQLDEAARVEAAIERITGDFAAYMGEDDDEWTDRESQPEFNGSFR